MGAWTPISVGNAQSAAAKAYDRSKSWESIIGAKTRQAPSSAELAVIRKQKQQEDEQKRRQQQVAQAQQAEAKKQGSLFNKIKKGVDEYVVKPVVNTGKAAGNTAAEVTAKVTGNKEAQTKSQKAAQTAYDASLGKELAEPFLNTKERLVKQTKRLAAPAATDAERKALINNQKNAGKNKDYTKLLDGYKGKVPAQGLKTANEMAAQGKSTKEIKAHLDKQAKALADETKRGVGTGAAIATTFTGGRSLLGAFKAGGVKKAAESTAGTALSGFVNAEGSTLAENPDASQQELGTAGLLGLLGGAGLHIVAGVGGKYIADAKGNRVTNEQAAAALNKAKQDKLLQTANDTPDAAQSLDANTTKSLDTVMSTVRTPKSALEAQATQDVAQVAATKTQQETAKAAEKAAADTKKIDQQLEILAAKKKDAKDGKLSNVDQVKIKQLKEQKAELAKTVSATEPTPQLESPATAVPEQAPAAIEKPVVPVKSSLPKDTTPKTLTPTQTAHMEPITGYTHSTALEKDYADMLRGMEKDATVTTVPDGKGGYKRVTEHSPFYRAYYKEHKKPPTQADYLEEAKRHLMSGKDAMGASEDYKKLLEREAKPIPRMEVNTTPIAGSGKTLKSKVGTGVESRAVAAKLTKSLGDLPEYSKVNMKQQGKDATDLLINDEQKAINIALGKEQPPAHLLPEAVYTAVEAKALATGDVDLLRALANSTRVSEATAMGQRIRALAERSPDSAVSGIKQVADARVKAYEKKAGKTATKAVSEEVKVIVKEKPKVTREDWHSFVDALKC